MLIKYEFQIIEEKFIFSFSHDIVCSKNGNIPQEEMSQEGWSHGGARQAPTNECISTKALFMGLVDRICEGEADLETISV